MKTFLFAAASAVVAQALTFDEWAVKHGKDYESEAERSKRAAIYETNQKFIAEHNSVPRSYTVGETAFADLTVAEFQAQYLSSDAAKVLSSLRGRSSAHGVSGLNLPKSVDWTTKGYVSIVKNQGQCGSAMSDEFAGAVESAAAISTTKLRNIDENQLSDCGACSSGCGGCTMSSVCGYAVEHGLTFQYAPNQCNYTPDIIVKSCANVASGNETALMEAISNTPVVVAVEADAAAFMMYTGGVLTDSGCGTSLNHVLLAVGYGVDTNLQYYKARNSWGTSWGEKGYIRIGRGKQYGSAGECGIQSAPVFPVIELSNHQ